MLTDFISLYSLLLGAHVQMDDNLRQPLGPQEAGASHLDEPAARHLRHRLRLDAVRHPDHASQLQLARGQLLHVGVGGLSALS